MNFLIDPFIGAGKLRFGMPHKEVRNLLGKNFKSFKRSPDSDYPCDHFESLGVFIYYKQSGLIEAIEFSTPAAPLFEKKDLLNLPFKDLKKFLLKKDKNLEVEPDSLTSYHLGIGAYTPDAEEDLSLPAESIIVFEKNYYD